MNSLIEKLDYYIISKTKKGVKTMKQVYQQLKNNLNSYEDVLIFEEFLTNLNNEEKEFLTH